MIRSIKRWMFGEWETKRIVTAHMGMISPSTGATWSTAGTFHLQQHSRTKAERSYWQCLAGKQRFPVTADYLNLNPAP